MCKQSNVITVARTVSKSNDFDCHKIRTIFHLLLLGVTITTIIKVGKVVAFSVSLFSAVRAKLDSCYLQRHISFSWFDRPFLIYLPENILNHAKPVPIGVMEHCSSYTQRNRFVWSSQC